MTNELEKRIKSLESMKLVEEHWKNESRKGIEDTLIEMSKEIVNEKIEKGAKRIPFIMPVFVILKEMYELYRAEEDGDLYLYLKAFGEETIRILKENFETEKELKKEMTSEEEAVVMLPPLQRNIFKLAFGNGKVRSSEELVKEMKYLSQTQVCKLMIAVTRNYYINLNLLLKVKASQ